MEQHRSAADRFLTRWGERETICWPAEGRGAAAGLSQLPQSHGPTGPRTTRLAQAGIEPLAGSGGYSFDVAWTESVVGPYKGRRRCDPAVSRRHLEPMKPAPLDRVDRLDHRRRLETIGNRPPAEAKPAYHRKMEQTALVA